MKSAKGVICIVNLPNSISYAEFCSGIGGFRSGISNSIYPSSCVYTNEIDDKCEQTYYANYGSYFDSKDIFSVNPASLPSFDMLCAGFPCQSFSIAGARLGFLDLRGTVIFKLLDIVSHSQPLIVFLENVPNLMYHEQGSSLAMITQELESLGYNVSTAILDSAGFGVPQSRPRLYIVAIRMKASFDAKYSFPIGDEQIQTVRAILSEGDYSIPISERWQEYIDLYTQRKNIDELSFQPPKTRTHLERVSSNCNLEDCILQIRSSGIRAYSLDSPFPTFAVSNSGGGAMIPVLTKERRHISLLEIKRLMGFRDDFIFTINRTDSIKQLANAVCPPVIHRIYDSIVEYLRAFAAQ